MNLNEHDSRLRVVTAWEPGGEIIEFDVSPIATPTGTASVPTLRKAVQSEHEQRLISAILQQPDDDEPRLRYADWLEEQSDPRGEFIRIQCQLARTTPGAGKKTNHSAKHTKLARRAESLLSTHFSEWTQQLEELQLRPETAVFRRGFLWTPSLQDIDLTDNSLKLLRHVPELEYLDLSGTRVTDRGIRHLADVTNLSDLDVGGTPATVKALRHLEGLVRPVRAHNFRWGNRPIREREDWKQIRNQRFLNLRGSKRREEAIRALKIIGHMPASKSGYPRISFSQSWATDADLVYLQAFPEVEELDFFECGAVTEAGLSHLESLKKLRVLRLSRTGVTDLSALPNLPALELLELDSLERLKPETGHQLGSYRKLQQLSVTGADQNDELLKHIAECSGLRVLELDYNRFTEDGLKLLLKLKKLEQLQFDCMGDYPKLVERLLKKN